MSALTPHPTGGDDTRASDVPEAAENLVGPHLRRVHAAALAADASTPAARPPPPSPPPTTAHDGRRRQEPPTASRSFRSTAPSAGPASRASPGLPALVQWTEPGRPARSPKRWWPEDTPPQFPTPTTPAGTRTSPTGWTRSSFSSSLRRSCASRAESTPRSRSSHEHSAGAIRSVGRTAGRGPAMDGQKLLTIHEALSRSTGE